MYHLPSKNGQDDWVGRSVTMILRPGICNAETVTQPLLLWSTMGGGKERNIETRWVGLLDIYSIIPSFTEDIHDDELDDEYWCFFTLTTNKGEVHIFEAITPEESQKLVIGIKNIAARLSSFLILSDNVAVHEYYDNQGEDESIQLSSNEAMI